MTAAIPFAGLAPDSRQKRGSGELSRFDLTAALEVGSALRKACSGDVSGAQVAEAVLDAVNAFEHAQRPACALLRFYVTRRASELPRELEESARQNVPASAAGSDPLYLRLIASRGIEPDWNDVASSVAQAAVLLEGERDPLFRELAQGLLHGEPSPPALTFHRLDATSSPGAPASDFLAAYGVRSVFGFATTAWPGETLVLLGFSRVALHETTVNAFEAVARQVQVSWLETREARARLGPGEQDRLRARLLGELAQYYELHLREAVDAFSTRLEQIRADTQTSAAAGLQQTEAHNAQLRRTQRAMLNVIEDLREARGALESEVASRTRELAFANQQLAARNRDLEEFVYIASHDLQEPLRTISGYLQMIQRRYGARLGAEADEFIDFAVQGANRMRELLESLLLYSRVGTADASLEAVNLAEPLAIALDNLAFRIEESRAVIEREPLPSVRANRLQMVQLFQNLLSNAIKFAGERPPAVSIASRREREFVVVSVRDQGIGFNPKFSERIFKLFRRLRRDTAGTGIGLAICKKIMERHGGRIEAQAAPDAGATFFLYFPDISRSGEEP